MITPCVYVFEQEGLGLDFDLGLVEADLALYWAGLGRLDLVLEHANHCVDPGLVLVGFAADLNSEPVVDFDLVAEAVVLAVAALGTALGVVDLELVLVADLGSFLQVALEIVAAVGTVVVVLDRVDIALDTLADTLGLDQGRSLGELALADDPDNTAAVPGSLVVEHDTVLAVVAAGKPVVVGMLGGSDAERQQPVVRGRQPNHVAANISVLRVFFSQIPRIRLGSKFDFHRSVSNLHPD